MWYLQQNQNYRTRIQQQASWAQRWRWQSYFCWSLLLHHQLRFHDFLLSTEKLSVVAFQGLFSPCLAHSNEGKLAGVLAQKKHNHLIIEHDGEPTNNLTPSMGVDFHMIVFPTQKVNHEFIFLEILCFSTVSAQPSVNGHMRQQATTILNLTKGSRTGFSWDRSFNWRNEIPRKTW